MKRYTIKLIMINEGFEVKPSEQTKKRDIYKAGKFIGSMTKSEAFEYLYKNDYLTAEEKKKYGVLNKI